MELSANELGSQLAKKFSGWVFPNGGKALTDSNQRIILRRQDDEDGQLSPFNQLLKEIKENRAVDISTKNKSPISCVYKALLNMRDDCKMIEPFVVSISGSAFKPQNFQVDNFGAPTPLYDQMFAECEREISERGLYMHSEEPVRQRFERFNLMRFLLKSTANASQVGSLLQTKGLLYLSSADSGLKFKDRQATKLTVAKHQNTLSAIIYAVSTQTP